MVGLDYIKRRLVISDNPAENDYLMSYYAPKFLLLIKNAKLDD